MDIQDLIKTNAQALLDKMIDDAVVEVEQEDEMYRVHIQAGDNAPTVIGRHGETLRALQKLLEVMLYKATQERVNMLIDVNDYREKQTERLHYIASEAAQKVQDRQSATYLRGFSSYERRQMHEYITEQFPDLVSFSIGEGRDRRMVIDIKREGEDHQEEPSDDYSQDEE
ncbi:KH domain-containing protein [Candidatus Woesebacteria bacterium]|nr:KH domain-containing protein [Candidatus Woesebacteria bacterium]